MQSFCKMIRRALVAAMVMAVLLSVMAIPTGAIKLIGSANVRSRLGVETEITTGMTLNENDAAMRLYYLGMLTGSGVTENGGIEFNLSAGLTRLESAVFATRLLGGEDEALENHYSHPFIDVPEWASDYVGYLYEIGLVLDDDEVLFYPGHAETNEQFMSYCLYALGFRELEGDYTYLMAAEYARDVGICPNERGDILTRGDAVLAMYNTLRATIKDSRKVYSDTLVKSGDINYNDAVFLLWSRDKSECEQYMTAAGYTTSWIIPDGYYTVKAVGAEQVLNVAIYGSGMDFEGAPITVWEDTGDITQTFRLERTERGTYYIYSAASRNGYGRVLGSQDGKNVGLYTSTQHSAIEWNITYATDGNWQIMASVGGDSKSLFVGDIDKQGDAVLLSDKAAQLWQFEQQGVRNAQGEEIAMFVANTMVITQGAYDVYSHQQQNAVDMTPTEGAIKAPFNGTIVKIHPDYQSCNAVWLQSDNKVHYADGTYDYMTLCLLHDNYIGDLYVGRKILQGEYFYQSGTAGFSSGSHVHVAVYKGKYDPYTMQVANGNYYIEDALFVPDDCIIYSDYGLDWHKIGLAD